MFVAPARRYLERRVEELTRAKTDAERRAQELKHNLVTQMDMAKHFKTSAATLDAQLEERKTSKSHARALDTRRLLATLETSSFSSNVCL